MATHGAHAHRHTAGAGESRLRWALAIVLVIIGAEIAGGIISRSLALLSDAGHMAVDGSAIVIALAAIRLGKRPPDAKKTYGYRRFEILATVVNGILLGAIVWSILAESWARLHHPGAVDFRVMVPVAVLGLAGNAVQVWLLHASRHTSHNLSMAWQHVRGDLISSLAVIIAGILIALTGWVIVDPIASIFVVAIIVRSGWRIFREAVDILLESAPHHVDVNEVARAIERVPGVRNVHDLHLTTHTTGQHIGSVHIVLDHQPLETALTVVALVRQLLRERFNVNHVTVEIDTEETSVGVQHRLYCEQDEGPPTP